MKLRIKQNYHLPKRIFDNIEESIKLAKMLEDTGIAAIGIHGRTRFQKSSDPVNKGCTHLFIYFFLFNIHDKFGEHFFHKKDAIFQIAKHLKIPVIASGGSDNIDCFEDIETFKKDCGASSVMIARGAQKNVSIFRRDGKEKFREIIK